MKWIGLTGGIATGKSTVAKMIRDLGLPVIDADSLAREVVLVGSPGLAAVVAAFGPGILKPDQSLDRSLLGQMIFKDAAKRERLEKILHPLIQEKKNKERRRLENEGAEIAFYDIPLLFEKNLAKDFDKTVLVYCSRDEQIQRLVERNQLSRGEAELRLQSQLPIDDKVKLADYVILNRQGLSELRANTAAVIKELLES
jgi:dephospho-CoA kinase